MVYALHKVHETSELDRLVRIKIIHRPRASCIDGVRLDRFIHGRHYQVGNLLGSYLMAEGWAVPGDDHDFALLTSLFEFDPESDTELLPPNLKREFYPPYYDGPQSLAFDRRRRRRQK